MGARTHVDLDESGLLSPDGESAAVVSDGPLILRASRAGKRSCVSATPLSQPAKPHESGQGRGAGGLCDVRGISSPGSRCQGEDAAPYKSHMGFIEKNTGHPGARCRALQAERCKGKDGALMMPRIPNGPRKARQKCPWSWGRRGAGGDAFRAQARKFMVQNPLFLPPAGWGEEFQHVLSGKTDQ